MIRPHLSAGMKPIGGQGMRSMPPSVPWMRRPPPAGGLATATKPLPPANIMPFRGGDPRAMPPQMQQTTGGPGRPMMPQVPMSMQMPMKSTGLQMPPGMDPRTSGPKLQPPMMPGGDPRAMPPQPFRGGMPGMAGPGGNRPEMGALSRYTSAGGFPGAARRPQMAGGARTGFVGRGIGRGAPNGLLRGSQALSGQAGTDLSRMMGSLPRGGLQRFAGGGSVRKKSNA